MILLLVNTSINSTSTGRIAEEIGRCASKAGFQVSAGYGFVNNKSQLDTIKIGTKSDHYLHALYTRLADRHGFGSGRATAKFLERLDEIAPDIVNLHNIHGYYLNVELLAKYLSRKGIPVVWTFHDCWPFTGHCSYFDAVHCDLWKSGCRNCPNKHGYPESILSDNSEKNYNEKRRLFCAIPNLTIVTPCHWMAENVKASFLGSSPVRVIYNGVDTDVFKPAASGDISRLRHEKGLDGKKIILGVASVWDRRKGLEDFKKLADMLFDDERIVLIGLNNKQLAALPENVIGVSRTENTTQLAEYYSMADVFVNPTYVDNFPTTNIEALACGTPVVTYNTGGSPEAIDNTTGRVVDKGDIVSLLNEIRSRYKNEEISKKCRERAVGNFDSRDRFRDYVNLFNDICTTTHSDQN